MTAPRFRSFAEALSSAGPAADRADKMSLYGWLIGDWRFDAVVHADDGARHTGEGEIHFAWVLEGPPSRTSGSCRAFSSARRCASTTPPSTPGTSCGATR
jgi:hypothetical protein